MFPLWLLKYLPNMHACHTGILWDAQGPSNSLTTSDAGGLLALDEAVRIIRRGAADLMLAGGAESRVNPVVMVRYCLLNRLATANEDPAAAARPFDLGRTGYAAAEGAAVLMLEEASAAEKRGARVYGEILGTGAGTDAVRRRHLRPRRPGRGRRRAAGPGGRRASGREDLAAVVAHAPGLAMQDRSEAAGLAAALGPAARKVPVTAIMGITGNMGAASGAGRTGRPALPGGRRPGAADRQLHPPRPVGGPEPGGRQTRAAGGRHGPRHDQRHRRPDGRRRRPTEREIMNRRVVITGMGSITPLGFSVEETWKNLLAGKSGIRPIFIFDAETFPTNVRGPGARTSTWPSTSATPPPWPPPAATSALPWPQGAWPWRTRACSAGGFDPERTGIYLGSGEGILDFHSLADSIQAGTGADGKVDTVEFARRGFQLFTAMRELEQEPNMPANHLAAEYGISGPTFSCLTACAASTQAIGESMDLIRTGRADMMLGGGTHSMIHPLGVTGFNLLTAVSTEHKDEPWRASRPFDRDRAGFVLGEGSTIMVLEELAHAQARGARIWAEMVGFGSSADAYRMTDIHPEGRGPAAAMRAALADAAICPEAIDYISAHGTGTQENDKVETLAAKLVFGKRAYQVPMSSVKSTLGHLIAAAGATELMTCVLAIRDQVLPPTMNLENPDPECDLDYVPNAARKAKVDVCLSNSFGFGGQNDSLVVRRFVA